MEEVILKIGKKGVTIIPKKVRVAAGVEEESRVKAQILPSGILLRPLAEDPVTALQDLPTGRTRGSSVERMRKLRGKIDEEIRSRR